ncbi:hypothetical protein CFHF_04255 [Caulobacter flavus]|uniref:Uncharacterized protein n=1 Tax=Caulobacter flavus TaxID=1679497 RepID=A0A2N5CZJ2_9CAUL|nr:hypothetical protein [Caulobacter flavus]AYV45097.1 hypothetical protein C1707_01915 [Caulobacter flavus]PLR19223.1 hypothetical protein CFHF_04255 [Caulobacter flavus]
MSLDKFHEEPWKTSHRTYETSALAIAPAPEYASSEVLLSSLYRAVGFEGHSESSVPTRGRELDRDVLAFRNKRERKTGAVLDADSLHMMLHSALESPKLPNQSAKRFLQVTPLVPQVAVFSGSARLAGNPWPAGALVRRMIWLGARDAVEAAGVWEGLFEALSVSADDDVFARFLQAELATWAPEPQWASSEPKPLPVLRHEDREGLSYPARQFVTDLQAIVAAKTAMTRRQWTSLLEAIVRIGTVSHVLWLCDVHDNMWSMVRRSATGDCPADVSEVRTLLFGRRAGRLPYGDRALPLAKDRVSAFLQARLGLNQVLWALEAAGGLSGGLSTSEEVFQLCEAARDAAARDGAEALLSGLSETRERENRTVLCRKGIGSNLLEFVRHALGQRQTANAALRGYDQGFVLRKKGAAASSPWIVSLGPVAVLALVHCSLAKTSGPRSVRYLAQHMSGYGIMIDHQEIAESDLGHQLRMLGLVLDSPDAESGMLLVPPFAEQAA